MRVPVGARRHGSPAGSDAGPTVGPVPVLPPRPRHLALTLLLALLTLLTLTVAGPGFEPAAAHHPTETPAPDPAADHRPTEGLAAGPYRRPEEGEVTRLYRAALGRAPDPDGFRYWVTRRIEGVTLAVVADSFVVSREFRLRFDTADDGVFVDRVYRNVLGREGDGPGVAYWRRELNLGLSREHLIVLFAQSPELRLLTGTDEPEPPPYQAAVRAVTVDELGASWRPGCPVPPDELRAVELNHVGYDGGIHRGTIIVHRDVTAEVTDVFAQLYRARFPLASLRPVAELGGDDGASMAADNSSGFNCRTVTGGRFWSRHAFGLAIDLNPVENPYVAGGAVLPPAGSAYLERSRYHPGMIRPGDVVVAAFARVGWRWGGGFRAMPDYQHLERN